ncbi:hypothetical protein [Dulcicalothrix desertica]|uniref:hypothetical protein n=1 Tax=Dulcicalothrix desertica TaxID=32056 RepID=UPI0016459F06|nr:hypothetical protein [Dulcicalothrix desertica]
MRDSLGYAAVAGFTCDAEKYSFSILPKSQLVLSPVTQKLRNQVSLMRFQLKFCFNWID